MKRAQEIDPLTPPHTAFLAWLHAREGHPAEAISEAKRALEIRPRHPIALHVLGLAAMHEGRVDDASAFHQRAAQASPAWAWRLGQTYARAGRRDDALRGAADIEQRATTWDFWGLAEIARHSYAPWIDWNPSFAPLRDQPQYLALARTQLYLAQGFDPTRESRAADGRRPRERRGARTASGSFSPN